MLGAAFRALDSHNRLKSADQSYKPFLLTEPTLACSPYTDSREVGDCISLYFNPIYILFCLHRAFLSLYIVQQRHGTDKASFSLGFQIYDPMVMRCRALVGKILNAAVQ